MLEPVSSSDREPRCGSSFATQGMPRIPVMALGMSLGVFFGLTYIVCVVFDLVFPGHAMYQAWLRLLPGFTWLTWPSFFLGLAESVAYGWYVALIFGPLFNFFAARWSRRGLRA